MYMTQTAVLEAMEYKKALQVCQYFIHYDNQVVNDIRKWEYSSRLFQEEFSREKERNENHSLYFKKSETSRNEIPISLTANTENTARVAFQQKVKTNTNSRNNNNWSGLPKDGRSAKKVYETARAWNNEAYFYI